jgi:hypothetical protein
MYKSQFNKELFNKYLFNKWTLIYYNEMWDLSSPCGQVGKGKRGTGKVASQPTGEENRPANSACQNETRRL